MTGRVIQLAIAGALTTSMAAPLAANQHLETIEVVVRDRTVRAVCTEGPRRVVLLHGEKGSAESWRPVLQRLSGQVGACAYDRTGTSGRPQVRGWFELLDQLRTVHEALGVEPGYTLVGHGVAGMYARLFAVDRPLDLGGLVLVDPAHEDMPREVRPGMPRAAWSWWSAQRLEPNIDGVREADLAAHARGTRVPYIPVTVITAMQREDGGGWDARFLTEAARRVHAAILLGVRRARHIPAQYSGHDVHLDAPDLVAGEITRMVRMTTHPAS